MTMTDASHDDIERDVIDLAAPQPAPTAAPDAPHPSDASEASDGESSALSDDELARITDDLVAAFKSVYDPEIPVDIYELGLIYKVDIDDDRVVSIDMTLTAPGCPVAGEMPGWVEQAAAKVEGVEQVKVSMVFDPPWTTERMSDEAKLQLNML